MDTEKRKYKCEGCGTSRPCYVETNQEPSSISIPIEDLKCVLDETNQTGFHWEEVAITDNAELVEALESIVKNGDYSAPEGMKLIARLALAKHKGEG